jgi:CBS domain-containing protein
VPLALTDVRPWPRLGDDRHGCEGGAQVSVPSSRDRYRVHGGGVRRWRDGRAPRADRRVMSVGAIAVDEKLTLRSVAAVLAKIDIGVVVVARANGTAAIVSERDVVRALAEGAEPDEVWVADVMTEDVVIADPDEPVIDVAARMGDEGVRHVAVVHKGAIVGVVSARDALDVLLEYVEASV